MMHDHEPTEPAAKVPARRADSAVDGRELPSPTHLPTQMGNREFTRHVTGIGIGSSVQRQAARSQGAGPLDPEIEANIRSAQGGGKSLDEPVRNQMESHLGVDLSPVRVHTDGRGDSLSRAVQADAFTTGTDVFFRSGKYAPETSDGQKLLAHELTHVVQQAAGAVPSESRVSHPDDPHEREAAAVADAVASAPHEAASGPAGTGVGAHRQAAPEEGLDEQEGAAVSRQASGEVPEDEPENEEMPG